MTDTSPNVRSKVISVINEIRTEHGKWHDTRRDNGNMNDCCLRLQTEKQHKTRNVYNRE